MALRGRVGWWLIECVLVVLAANLLASVTTSITVDLMRDLSPYAQDARRHDLALLPWWRLVAYGVLAPLAVAYLWPIARWVPPPAGVPAPAAIQWRVVSAPLVVTLLAFTGWVGSIFFFPVATIAPHGTMDGGPDVAAGAVAARERLPRRGHHLPPARPHLPPPRGAGGLPARARRRGARRLDAGRARAAGDVPRRGRLRPVVHPLRAGAGGGGAPGRGHARGPSWFRSSRAPARCPSASSPCSASRSPSRWPARSRSRWARSRRRCDASAAAISATRVAVSSADEVGVVEDGVNALADTLRERDRILGTFGRVVDPAVRDRLLAGEVRAGRRAAHGDGAVRRSARLHRVRGAHPGARGGADAERVLHA